VHREEYSCDIVFEPKRKESYTFMTAGKWERRRAPVALRLVLIRFSVETL